jgi:pectate lyase
VSLIRGILTCGLFACAAAGNAPAFPGADGFGAVATGGRGGTVYHVTNLDDSGPGSLRDAASAGHRIVVFDVGGYIQLKSALPISSDMTIAGQSAPGDGIATRGYEVSFSESHNVICRFIRFRQGCTPGQEHKSAVAIYHGQDIILDHVSIEWGRWDDVDMNESTNVTIQNSIIGEGVSPQRFGCLCQSQNVTFRHDLFINNHSRNPKAKGKIQYINNVCYNWELAAFIEGGESKGESWDDVVGNCFIAGPSTGDHPPISGGNANAQVYAADNFLADQRSAKLEGHALGDADLGLVTIQKAPFGPLPEKVDSPQQTYAKIVASVGDSLHRDTVDKRIIDQLTSLGTKGAIINSPDDVGGFGTLAEVKRSWSIPDDWKIQHGLKLGDPSVDDAPFGNSGYTNLEAYLNSLGDSGN